MARWNRHTSLGRAVWSLQSSCSVGRKSIEHLLWKRSLQTIWRCLFFDDILTSGGIESFRHDKQYWIWLHNSGLLHPLSTRRLVVALELYEHQKTCAEWHMHVSVQRCALPPMELTWVILSSKSDFENVMLFHVAYCCLASYDLIFNESVHWSPGVGMWVYGLDWVGPG